MAKAKQPQQYKTNISKPYNGVHNDNNPIDQPKGCPRFVLNGVNEAEDGQQMNISNERGMKIASLLPEGFYPLGDRYTEGDEGVVIITNPTTKKDQIGLIDKNDIYNTIVDTGILGLKINHQCDIIYRLRRGRERVIYWVDGLNKPRSFNLDRQYDYYATAYQTYIRGGGDPNTYVGEKWDNLAFNLIKSFKSLPFFIDVSVIEVGSIVPGSFNFAIQYVDSDINPTEWITTSNTVNIYNDSVDTSYYKIRGSRNSQNAYQTFEPANKSIRLTLANLDTDFPYYRIAIICGTGVTGQPIEVFASDIQSTSDNVYVYAGNNGSLTKITLDDILIQNEILFAPNHIEQIENRLILADTRGKGVNWCEFQKFASKISSNLALKDVILNSVASEPNVKNAKSTFLYRGYMPGDVASFGIVYLFDDFTLSPAFTIPGIPVGYSSPTGMIPYELPDTLYQDIHNCSTDDYWGKDSLGNTLVGTPVRHHRFPFRKDIGAPLFTRTGATAVIPRYRLSFKVTLVAGQVWPTNPDTTNKIITYKLIYKIGSTGSNITITRTIIKSQENTSILIYDSTDALGDVSATPGTMAVTGTIEEVLLTEAGTLSDYITSGVFTISGVYSTYNADTVYNVDTSKIYGIEFSNIEKPRADIIGFYIVRNERKDDDKLVVDNAVFGPTIENEQYRAFGLVMPKQYYTVNTVTGSASDCHVSGTKSSGKTLTYAKRVAWFFNPEYQFFAKKNSFNSVNIQGTFIETGIDLPTRKPEYGGCTQYRGISLQDVQPGTSFNSDINSGSDSDGFDMLIGYRNTNINYQSLTYTFPITEKVFYINASSYQNHNADVLYNVSSDNKIGMLYFSSDVDTEKFYNTTTKKNLLVYGALVKDNNTAYSNFINRPYYKEHNNPFLFGSAAIINNISVFNGDAYISPLTLNSSTYFNTVVADRDKKTRVWQIVLGAWLVVAGVVAAIVTAGASSVLSAAAISYGISLAVAGFKFEQFKNMIDSDYEKGLKDCVTDGAVYECLDETVETQDDTIRWFGDRVTSMYIESSVPFGLRDGLTSGVLDFLDSPTSYEEDVYRNYLIEKLTTIDREQGSGRLYKGYATAEFYSMNPDYMRFNKETIFSHLALEYDCCTDPDETFATRVWWSEQSFQEEKVDNYRVFLPNNYKDIEGEHGSITDLFRQGNALFVQCKEVLWQLPQNIQERVTSEVVSFIGTGEFFNIPPRKIVDDNLGSAGTQHKWATIKTKYGIIFMTEIENKVYILGDKIREISNEGLRNWFKNHLVSYLSQQFYANLNISYPNDNNPANPAGIGYLAAFDTRHNRYILTKRDYLYLGNFDNIIPDFDPSQNYAVGKIFIDENGFEEILNIQFTAPIVIPTLGWIPINWNVTGTYLEHIINVRSIVYKTISTFKLNTVYRITYEVYNYLGGSINLKVGTIEGPGRFGNGIYTESYLITNEEDKTISFSSNGSLRVRNISYEEKVFTTQNMPFTDVTKFENKSWTISYSFYSNSWIGWHSYIPLYYIHNQNSLYSFIGDRAIWKHNIEGVFHKFYGINFPFIIEHVPPPSLETKTWEDITLITKARKWNAVEKEYQDERFITFNKMIAYTDRGCTGEVNLVVKDNQANPQNWLFQQLVNTFGDILITRKERDWNLNEIRDFVDDPSKPLFSTAWSKLQGVYFIDKVVNSSNIDPLKPWNEIEMLRDKFIVIRLKFDNFEDVNLIFNYALDTESTSNR